MPKPGVYIRRRSGSSSTSSSRGSKSDRITVQIADLNLDDLDLPAVPLFPPFESVEIEDSGSSTHAREVVPAWRRRSTRCRHDLMVQFADTDIDGPLRSDCTVSLADEVADQGRRKLARSISRNRTSAGAWVKQKTNKDEKTAPSSGFSHTAVRSRARRPRSGSNPRPEEASSKDTQSRSGSWYTKSKPATSWSPPTWDEYLLGVACGQIRASTRDASAPCWTRRAAKVASGAEADGANSAEDGREGSRAGSSGEEEEGGMEPALTDNDVESFDPPDGENNFGSEEAIPSD